MHMAYKNMTDLIDLNPGLAQT